MNAFNKNTIDYIRNIRSNGKYSFTIEDLINTIPKSKKNLRKDLDRLRGKGEIMNIRRGFYTIIPDEYQNMGALPVALYADDLMKYLKKKYYVGLYSAAMVHGAAHQQPQEFYFVTNSPGLRNINKSKFVINFSEKRKFPIYGIEEKKTETGFLKISNPELTFFDLIYFEKNIGGLSRIITILSELKEVIKQVNFKEVMKNEFPLTVYQRAGYILEHILPDEKLSNLLEKRIKSQNTRITLLSTAGKKYGEVDLKWKVKVNRKLESEI